MQLALLVAAAVAAPAAFAQITAHTGAALTTVYTSTSGGGEGLALDASGNVFTGFNAPVGIYKSTYSNGTYSTASTAVVADYFFGLASDSAGNLYAADESNGNIDKIAYSGGSYTLTTLFKLPSSTTAGVAVDGYGNIYTNNYGTTLYKYTLSGGVYTAHTIATNFSQTRNLAVDANGVIYQADGSASKVRVFAPVGAVATTTTYTEGTAFACGVSCAGVAVASNGTVYIGANNILYQETPNGSGGYVQTTVSNAFNQIRGMAVDLSGNVFVGDLGTQKVTKTTTALPDFGTVTVGTTSAQQPITFVIDSNTGGTALGTPKFLTQGISGGDFAGGTGSTCTGVLAAGSTCTIYATFTPQSAGLRTGAVELTDANGNILATALVRGVGNAGQAAFLAPRGTVLSGVPSAPRAIAVDEAGNIYDPNSTATLYKVNSSGASTALYTSSNSSSVFAAAAVDGAGNIYLVDRGTGNMVEISATGTLLRTIALGASVANSLGQVALDASATAYIADGPDGKIIEVNQAGAVTSLAVTGYNSGNGVAVDRNGTVYVTLATTNQIAEITNGVQTNVTPTGAALNGPNSLAVDAAGDLWVTNGSNGIVFITPAGVGTKLNTTGFSTGFIYGIAFDGKGNLYFPDQVAGSVNVVNLSTNQALGFPTTPVGSSSASQSIILANIGTQSLSFPAPGSGVNPSLSAGFSLSNSSSCPQVSSGSGAGTLPVGTTCTQIVSFAPAMTGSYSGSLVITDNSLNASPSTSQSVAVSGTGSQGPIAIGIPTVSGLPGSTVAVTATISYGGVAPAGTVTMSVGALTVSPLTCTASSYTETCTGHYSTGALPAGNYTISANISADANYTAGSGTGTLTLVPASFNAPGTAVGSTSAAQTATLVFSSATTLNTSSATAIQVVTQGVAGKDFVAVTGGTCTPGTSYAAGTSCTVQYTFKPLAPGVRLGAVLLYDGSSNMVASTYLSGIGQGPLVNFEGNGATTFAGAIAAASIAIDPAGNVFYAQNTGSGRVIELNASGTQIGTSGIYYGPVGVAIDGVGNVYTYSSGGCCSNTLTKYPNGNLSTPQSFSITTAGQIDGSLAVDGAGNIYLPSAHAVNSGFIKLTPQGSGYGESTALTNKAVSSVAVDSAGNVYAATMDNQLYMVTPSGTSTLLASTGLNFPLGLAVDAAGNIYVGNTNSQNVVRFAAGTYAQTVVASGFATYGVALDALGNLYIGDTTNNRIARITRTPPPVQTFGNTPVGATSAADVLKLENNGNTALSFAGFATSSVNFVVDSATTTCSLSSTLPSGGVCAVGTRFAPQSTASSSGSLTLTDTNLNVAGSTQTGTLNGTASLGSEIVTTASLSAVSGSSAALSAVISYGGVQPTGIVSFKIGTGAVVAATCTAGAGSEICTASYPTAGLLVGNNTITAAIAADSNYAGASINTAVLTVVPGSYTAPTTAVSSPSPTQTATVVLSQAGTANAISALTGGSANLDYKVVSFTCSGSTVGSTCTVQYTFKPTAPGTRNGGLLLLASNGTVLGSSYLTGVGTGPQAVVYPGTQTTLLSGLVGDAFGIAIDGNRNLYVGRGPGSIYKETYASGTYTQSTLGSGMNDPSGIAVDGLGNVFVADTNNGRIVEEVNGPTGYTQTAPFTGLNAPFAVAVDGVGNVYIGAQGQLLKETYSGGTYNQTTLDSGLSNIISLAADGAGNLYVADAGNAVLYKETYSGGFYSRSTIATGLGNVNGVAVDAAGTVYAVADGTSTHVLRYAPDGSGGYIAAQTVGTFARTNGIAIDTAGNLYVTDDGASNSVDEINVASAGSYVFGTTSVGTSTGADTATVNNIGNAPLTISALGTSSANFSLVAGSTTCSTSVPLPAAGSCVLGFASTPQTSGAHTGTVTVTDNSLNIVNSTQLENVSGSATAGVVTLSVSNATVVAGSPAMLNAMITYAGAQPTGNVTFQVGSGATVNAICIAGAGSETCTASYPTAGLSVGNNTITATIAADSNYAGLASSTAIVNVVPGSFAAPSTAVGSASATQTATLVFAANATLNANPATAIQVVTQGATGLDFGYVAGGTNACTAGATYTAGQTCTVQYTFTPQAPGQRLGGITLLDGSGNVLTGAFLSGTGTGPVAIFPTASAKTTVANVAQPTGVARDAAGNLYVTDYTNGSVLKYAAVNGAVPANATPQTLASGLAAACGVAVDGIGNVFAISTGKDSITEIPFSGTAYGTPVTIVSGESAPCGAAVDANGNVYFSNQSAGTVREILASAGAIPSNPTVITVAGGFSSPQGEAIDANGNVYVVSTGNNLLYQVPFTNGSFGTPVSVPVGTSGFFGITMDGSGNLYLGAMGTTPILEVQAVNGTVSMTNPSVVSLGSGFGGPRSIAVDGAGNLFVADFDNQAITRLNLTDGPALTLANTAVGSTSAPQTTPVLNNGNAPLAIAGLSTTSLNFSVDATSTTCSKATALVTGATCNVGATFAPSVGGVQTASLNITDNNLNATSVVQAVSLIGTGNAGSSNITVGSVSVVYGTATAALSATVTFPGTTLPTSGFSFTVGTGTTVAATCTGSASPLTCTATYPVATLAANSYTVTGTLAADANIGTASATATLTVTQATPALSVVSSSASFSNASTTLTAMLTYTGSTAPSGAVTFQVGSGPLVTAACSGTSSPLTCTAAYPLAAAVLGSNQIHVSLAADTNDTATTATGTLTLTAATATVTVSSVTVEYSTSTATLTSSIAYTGNTAPVGPFTFSVGSGAAVTAACSGPASPLTCTASYNTASLSPKSYTITGTLAADAHFGVTTATGTLTITPATPAVTVAGGSIGYGTASTSLSATIAYTGAVPTGALTFAVDNSPAVTATCKGSASPLTCTATYPAATLATGAHIIKVSSAADANYAASSGRGTLTVVQTTPAITVANQSGSYGGASTSLVANVAYSGSLAPTGAVSFMVDNGAAVVATCSGTASPLTCSAVYPTANLTAGSHPIAVTSAADANYKAAAGSGNLTIAVTAANISFNVGNHAYGEAAVTLAATSNSTGAFTYSVVSGPATVAGTTLTITGVGTVVLQASQAADPNFSAGSRQASFTIAQAALTATANNVTRTYGAANPTFTGSVNGAKYSDTFTETFSTIANTTSAVGTYPIVPAVMGADLADYSAALTNGTLTITQAATTTSLTASAASLNPGQNLTLTASVASGTSGTPTGSVTFFDNGAALTTVALVNGTAVFSTSSLAPGTTHSLTVSYAGDTNFLPGATALGSSVTIGALDFTFNTTGATAYTAAPGTVATFNFALSPDFGSYASTVNLAVTGLPAGATYSFSPSTIASTGGAQPVVLSVQTPKATAKNGSAPLSPMERGAPVLALLLLPGLGFRRVRRRLGARMLTLILLVAGLGGAGLLTGCGTSNGFQLQPQATYTLTVTATSGSLQHTQTVTLTVQ